MHFTGAELAIASNAVAIAAIIAGYAGVRSANRNQLRLARDGYQRDHLTETYLDLLKGVHLRGAQLDDSLNRPAGAPSRTPTWAEYDPTTDGEATFSARLLAYASPKVEALWVVFTKQTAEFDDFLNSLRRDLPGAEPRKIINTAVQQKINDLDETWMRTLEILRAQVRAELLNPGLAEKARPGAAVADQH